MDSPEIEAFLALADELHFGRAADRLVLSRSRVSRLIASLERKAGGPLFERTSRQVTLTPAGLRLRDRVGPAWSEIGAAFAETRSALRAPAGTLRLGWPSTCGGPSLTRLAKTFITGFPECDLSLHDLPFADLYGPVRRGEIDVLAYWLAGGGPALATGDPGLAAGPVLEYRDRVLAVGAGHRLAGRDSVSVEDLAGEKVTAAPPEFPEMVWDSIVPPCTPSGRPILRARPWRSSEETIVEVVRCRLVHPTVTGLPGCQRDDMRIIPIRDLPPLPLGLIWRAAQHADGNAMISALAGVACRIRSRAPDAPVPVAHREVRRSP